MARLAQRLREIHDQESLAGLVALPGMGTHRRSHRRTVDHRRWQSAGWLRGSADPEAMFRAIPGIGPDLAHRLHAAAAHGVGGPEPPAGQLLDGDRACLADAEWAGCRRRTHGLVY